MRRSTPNRGLHEIELQYGIAQPDVRASNNGSGKLRRKRLDGRSKQGRSSEFRNVQDKLRSKPRNSEKVKFISNCFNWQKAEVKHPLNSLGYHYPSALAALSSEGPRGERSISEPHVSRNGLTSTANSSKSSLLGYQNANQSAITERICFLQAQIETLNRELVQLKSINKIIKEQLATLQRKKNVGSNIIKQLQVELQQLRQRLRFLNSDLRQKDQIILQYKLALDRPERKPAETNNSPKYKNEKNEISKDYQVECLISDIYRNLEDLSELDSLQLSEANFDCHFDGNRLIDSLTEKVKYLEVQNLMLKKCKYEAETMKRQNNRLKHQLKSAEKAIRSEKRDCVDTLAKASGDFKRKTPGPTQIQGKKDEPPMINHGSGLPGNFCLGLPEDYSLSFELSKDEELIEYRRHA